MSPRERVVPAGGIGGILIATVAAGVVGYLITFIAARGLGAADYAAFSAFWGALYLLVGSLSGVQQEVSRASSPGAPDARGARDVSFLAAGIALITLVLVAAGGFVVAPTVFGAPGEQLIVPLALGLAFNAAVVAYSGITYGLAMWRVVAFVILLDVVLRLAAILVAVALHADLIGYVWATVIPFPLVLVYLIAEVNGRRRRVALDVALPGVAANVARTVGASIGMAVLVSGFPLLIGLARGSADDVEVGILVFALIVTRAPIVVSVLGLQSYLVVFFRTRSGRRVPGVLAIVGVVGGVLAFAAWLWGPAAITVVAGREFQVSGELLAGLVLASVPTAWLALSGAVVLSHARHVTYVLGWSVAAAAGVLLLFLVPGDLDVRTLIALSIAPLLGFAVHALGTILGPERTEAEHP